jgi:hypothetical protein
VVVVEDSKEGDVVGLMIVTEVTWVIGAEEIIEEILGTTGVTEGVRGLWGNCNSLQAFLRCLGWHLCFVEIFRYGRAYLQL